MRPATARAYRGGLAPRAAAPDPTLTGWFCEPPTCPPTLAVVPNHAAGVEDPNSQATVELFGQPVGRYVDNEQPAECAAVGAERLQWPVVIAGVAPGSTSTCPQATLNAFEYYPLERGILWGPPPNARAYILQDRFHWPGNPPPTAEQREQLLRAAMAHRPVLVLWH